MYFSIQSEAAGVGNPQPLLPDLDANFLRKETMAAPAYPPEVWLSGLYNAWLHIFPKSA